MQRVSIGDNDQYLPARNQPFATSLQHANRIIYVLKNMGGNNRIEPESIRRDKILEQTVIRRHIITIGLFHMSQQFWGSINNVEVTKMEKNSG